MNILTNIWQWLVYSSANSEKYSLTLKGALGIVATILLTGAGIFQYTLSPDAVNGLSSLVVVAFKDTLTAVSYIVTAVSSWALVWGAIRKVVLTLQK